MPCNSDYLDPNSFEKQLSKVCCLLDELLYNKSIKQNEWNGYHPNVYYKYINKEKANKLVNSLCSKLQMLSSKEIKNLSLEMQIWWRNHQKADKKRIKEEIKLIKKKQNKEKALKKLTSYERKLLNLSND